jgi:hypothetical protein
MIGDAVRFEVRQTRDGPCLILRSRPAPCQIHLVRASTLSRYGAMSRFDRATSSENAPSSRATGLGIVRETGQNKGLLWRETV